MKKLIRTTPNVAGRPEPVTFRLPPPGVHDAYFGCARTFWNQNVLPTPENNYCPPVKSFVLKRPGTTRGIRLILFESAKAYFNTLAEESSETPA